MLCVGFRIEWEHEPLFAILAEDKSISDVFVDGVRFLEAEAAMDMGIPFDEHWYSIDVTAREHMIATRIARVAITNLQTKKARARAR